MLVSRCWKNKNRPVQQLIFILNCWGHSSHSFDDNAPKFKQLCTDLQDAIVTRGIDNIVMGMMSQAVEAADRFVVEDLAGTSSY